MGAEHAYAMRVNSRLESACEGGGVQGRRSRVSTCAYAPTGNTHSGADETRRNRAIHACSMLWQTMSVYAQGDDGS